jgi:ubiquinone/menaquinone biosynthesis C-methylase UbiE
MSAKQHWETIYRTKATTEVSWFQREAHVSLDLIRSVAPDLDSAILDVGGGASTLVDGLIERGYRSVTVLDIAPAALAAARERLGPAADGVRWIVADALTHPLPPGSVDVWHDRALFHFLTSADDRRTYVAQVQRAVRPNGHVIVATFAAEGPTRCSGLEVRRYGPTELHR